MDLFSGIGGFAYAIDQVYEDVEHVFVEIDPFCQSVLRKHWPESEIYGDIRTVTNTTNTGTKEMCEQENNIFLITGGFPCQPFAQAGQRKGTDDNRYLWPEMFRVIREFEPSWVIAENVYGLVTWNEGMVLEQVCFDLESQGYEVQPFIIPAVAVSAPHRRDRIWIVGHSKFARLERHAETDQEQEKRKAETRSDSAPSWGTNWVEVATELCGMDDGLPARMDGFELSRSRHRKERLKALGNAIVPQVAEQIIRSIKESEGV